MNADLSGYQWVIVPPAPNRPDWVSSLRQSAQSSGYVLHDWDSGQTIDTTARAIILTHSLDEARQHQPDHQRIACILDADGALSGPLEQSARHHVLQDISRGFAAAATLPQDRLFGSDRIAAGALRLFADLTVEPPSSSAPVNGVLADAFLIYTRGEATWAGDLFTWNTPPTHAAGRSSLDLTGRPRIVVYGPYMEMPAGRWKAVFTLSVDSYSCRYLFRADWGGVENYTSQEFRPGRPGVFRIEMVYDWAIQGACEFRLLVMEGVFHGQISMSDIAVSRVDSSTQAEPGPTG